MTAPASPRKTTARPLADLIGPVIGAACRKRGFAAAELVTFWPEIVGPELAERAQPERLIWPADAQDMEAGATLVVRAEGRAGLVLQHSAPQILERLNDFLGWRAVVRLRVHAAPLKPAPEKAATHARALTRRESVWLERLGASFAEEALGAAVARLGRAVLSRSRGIRG